MENKRNGWYTDVLDIKRHYHDGELHREDGPAVIFPSGSQYWYRNGKEVSMETVLDTPEKMEAYLLEESIRRL